ncbi:MAG: alpha/beta hydrolase [Deltaproteobacteria bacterium]|nr:alpha/beta hydrolase [Deltaproteobacteria bacterium]
MYYEIVGHGPPLLMLMGLRRDHTWYFRQAPELARHFQVILMDNRGAGQSGKPDAPYTIAGMAEDTIGLMDALGLAWAHVLGVSMGGCIAQELALGFPQRVRGLVLACTTCGGSEALTTPEHIMRWYADPEGMSPEEVLRRNLRIYFSDRYLREEAGEVEGFIQMALKDQQPVFAFKRQMDALRGFASASRLPGLAPPTLVATGSDDGLIPPENSLILAGLIPDSSLMMFPQGRHCFFIEMASRFNKEITSFLHQVDRA